jgi:DNA-binding transcriptional ArsR family regulator
MDKVFKALADPVRRDILDRLLEHDGVTLSQLCEGRDMTRFGIMKHLSVLERANLIVCRRVGRNKLHYLNPDPICQVQDRWMARYGPPPVEHTGGDTEGAGPGSRRKGR